MCKVSRVNGTLNLIVMGTIDAVQSIIELLSKIETIIKKFHKSPKLNKMLIEEQK